MPDPEPLVKRLEWDSAFFDLRIARYSPAAMDSDQAREVFDYCRRERIDCMYFLVDPHDVVSLDSARTMQMRMTGIRLVFHLRSLDGYVLPDGGPVRPAVPADMDRLASLASVLHTTTRFFLDPGFDRERVGELYSTWLRKSFGDPGCAVFASGLPGAPTGYCLARNNERGAFLELLGVEERCQGSGLGHALMAAGLAWLRSTGGRDARLVTQGGGPGLISFYERAGFTVESVKLWFHYWPNPGGRV